MTTDPDPWTALLSTASQPPPPKKHLIICGEPSRGKRTLLRGLIGKSGSSVDGTAGLATRSHTIFAAKRGAAEGKAGKEGTEGKEGGPLRLDVLADSRLKPSEGLILGYEYIDISPSESDRIPPLSVYTAPSSDVLMRRTLERAIPCGLDAMSVMIVLSWTKPQTMLDELMRWLSWIDSWTTEITTPEERAAGRERLQSIIQHYNDAPHDPSMADVVLPLDPETLVHNASGIPITIVLTHTDTIPSVGSKLISRGLVSSKGYSGRSAAAGEETREYLGGMGWEERVEWVGQVVRTVALRYGASVISTTTANPETFQILRAHILHSLYTTITTPRQSTAPDTKFPFPYPVNALDRDKLVIPMGWDSPVRIRVLREGFDVARVGEMWDDELRSRGKRERERDGKESGLRDLWRIVVPTPETESRETSPLVTCENEQSFLSRQLEYTLRHPTTDRARSFRPPSTPRPGGAAAGSSTSVKTMIREVLEDGTMPRKPVGVVGPVASGGLGMPSVEAAVARMEGDEPEPTPAVPATSNELLNNFFQGLIAGRRTPGSTPVKE